MGKDYEIAGSAGTCTACGRVLQEGEQYVAGLIERGEDQSENLERRDWCLACWEARDGTASADLFGHWRTSVPVRQAKQRLFVDDEMLMNLFHRLQDEAAPLRVAFRFVLALVLMRKRLLVYEHSTRDESGTEVWTMRQKGIDQTFEVVNPQLDADRIAEVSAQLGEILQGEL